ncbi:MAG: acetate--CoA ligase family protein [Candidatus Bipolaricaulota bacterium]|nr:acetate--CoA ligase family protein [Candidatus Bipolaricaulota bacterium]
MKRLFNPRGVAIIGASTNPGKIGYRIVENMVKSGYTGRIYPINPKGGEILGWPVHATLAEVEGDVDVAVLSVPADHVMAAVADCGAKRVGHLVVVTSGFSEIGNIAGEKDVVALAHAHGMRVLGPNVFGIYSASSRLDATFGPGGILPGHVAIVTQSGALGIAMIGKTAAESLGLSALISVGNKSDIDEADLLTYLGDDPETRVVLLYIEGVKNGERLVRMLRQVTKRKHVVVIKSGRSARGAMAAASHTGSLAGADDVFDDVMRECGVLRAESVQEAFNWVRFLASAPLPSGEDAVIVTNGGGIGVLATDACEKYGVRLYDNQPVLAAAFAEVMPEFGSSKNPVDLTGQATGQDYARSLDAVLARSDMHAAIALYCETALFDTAQFADLLRSVYRRYEGTKPIVLALFGGERIEAMIRELRSEGIPVFGDVYEAISVLGALYRSWRRLNEDDADQDAPFDIDIAQIRRVLQRAGAQGRVFLLAHEAAEVALALGLCMPRSILARDMDEAVRAAETIGYPVVMKVVSKDIVHKSDAGGVALNLENRSEVVDAYQAILRSCLAHKPDAVIEGVEVVEMVRAGVETIVGARQDPSFGPVAMFGLGGIYVEVMKDVSFRAAPLTARVAREMIGSIRSYPLLLGVRGERRKDIGAAADVVMRLGRLIAECREITDIEVNPLVVYDYGEGVKAVDVRILFQTQGGDAA